MSIDENFFEGVNKIKVIKNKVDSMTDIERKRLGQGVGLSVGVALLALTIFMDKPENINKENVEPVFTFSKIYDRSINLSASLNNEEVEHFYGKTKDMPTIEVLSSDNKEEIMAQKRIGEIRDKFAEKSRDYLFQQHTLESLKTPNYKLLSKENLAKKELSLEEIDKIGKSYGLPDKLLSSVFLIETRGDCSLKSNKNAVGCFQFLNETAEMFGLKGKDFDYRKKIVPSADASARYLAWLFKYLEREVGNGQKWSVSDLSKWSKAIGAYNAGPSVALRYHNRKMHPYKETRDYIRNIIMLTSGKGHWVEKGERIENISEKYGIEESKLMALNGGISNSSMKYATVLQISEPDRVDVDIKVKKGDTLYRIALATKTSVEQIKEYNNLATNEIKIGQEIKVPVEEYALSSSFKKSRK